MDSKTFIGDATKPGFFNGTGVWGFVTYNSGSPDSQRRVIIDMTGSGVAGDNFGNRMRSIESFDFSRLNDRIEIDYSLATNPGVVSAGLPLKKFLINMFLYDGDDYLSIGDALPHIPKAASYRGAMVDAGGGNDFLSLGRLGDQVYGGTGNDTIRGNGGKDNLLGGKGGDQIYGGTGDDTITPDDFNGSKSQDLVVGGAGKDTIILYDNRGNDIIQYLKTSDTTVAKNDSILYFEVGIDKIDLREIDANSTTGPNNAFEIVDDLTGQAGELAYDIENGTKWFFEGDVNGDGKADFEILVIQPKFVAGHNVEAWFEL